MSASESDPRYYSWTHTSQRKPNLCKISGVLWELHTWVPWVPESPCPKFITKESDSNHLSQKSLAYSLLQSPSVMTSCPGGQAQWGGAGSGPKTVKGRKTQCQNKAVNWALATTDRVSHFYTKGTGARQVTEVPGHVHVEKAGTIWGSFSWEWVTQETVPLGETLWRAGK